MTAPRAASRTTSQIASQIASRTTSQIASQIASRTTSPTALPWTGSASGCLAGRARSGGAERWLTIAQAFVGPPGRTAKEGER